MPAPTITTSARVARCSRVPSIVGALKIFHTGRLLRQSRFHVSQL